MTKHGKLYLIAAILILISLGILVHQYFVYGAFIELKDVLHHEFLAFTLLALAMGIVCATYAASK